MELRFEDGVIVTEVLQECSQQPTKHVAEKPSGFVPLILSAELSIQVRKLELLDCTFPRSLTSMACDI